MDWLSEHWGEISALVALVLGVFSTYKVRKIGK